MLQEIVGRWPFGRDRADILWEESLEISIALTKPWGAPKYRRSQELTGGACVNTLYSWLSHSSSSRIEATFPHLTHMS